MTTLPEVLGDAPDNGRPFAELRTEGILWAINRQIFHPRGYSLALRMNLATGEALGWSIEGDGSEPHNFEDGTEGDQFAAFNACLAER